MCRRPGKPVSSPPVMRIVCAAGYEGSERSLCRAVAQAKAAWRERQALEGRIYRPWVSEPGDGCSATGARQGRFCCPDGPRKLSFFSSVLGWSRYRSLRFCSERFGALAARLAASRPTRWLDLVSCGVFLWHIEAVHFAQMYLAFGWTWQKMWIICLFAIVAAVAPGALSYGCVERFAVRFNG